MKKGSHKNQIIITTLALLLAVVGYISYDNRDTFMNAKDVLSTEIEAVNGKADTKEPEECEDTQVSDEVALETDSTEEIFTYQAKKCFSYRILASNTNRLHRRQQKCIHRERGVCGTGEAGTRAGALKEQGGSAEDYR